MLADIKYLKVQKAPSHLIITTPGDGGYYPHCTAEETAVKRD